MEAGRMRALNATDTSLEFQPLFSQSGRAGGTCFASSPPATSPCTITLTVSMSSLGLDSGSGLFSITGLSAFLFGTITRPPLLRIEGGDSEQADAAPPFDDTGTASK